MHFPKACVCVEEAKSDSGEPQHSHRAEGGRGENDFVLQMRSNFGEVTQMAPRQLLNNSS